MARPSRAAYGMARYGAVVALKLMMRPSTSPPTMPTRMEVPTTEASPVDMYCDQGHSAPASSTTSSRNDLLIDPCSVMRSPLAIGRGWLEKVLSFNPGSGRFRPHPASGIGRMPQGLQMNNRIRAFGFTALLATELLTQRAAWAVFDSASLPTDSDLKVLRVVPEGNQVPPPGRQIVVTFDRPVTPLGTMAVEAAQSKLTVSPTLTCQWHWIDPRSLACELNAAQAMA